MNLFFRLFRNTIQVTDAGGAQASSCAYPATEVAPLSSTSSTTVIGRQQTGQSSM